VLIMGRPYRKSPVVEDLEWMLAMGESWERALERLEMTANAVMRRLDREDRVDLAYRLRQDWDGMAQWRARRAAQRQKYRLRRRRRRARQIQAWKIHRRRTAERLASRRRSVEAQRKRAERERQMASVIRDRFSGPVDVDELRPRCETPGCDRWPERGRKHHCCGHGSRIRRYGYAFPEIPLDQRCKGWLRRAVEERRAMQATAEEKAS
jgi:hypothetical protein